MTIVISAIIAFIVAISAYFYYDIRIAEAPSSSSEATQEEQRRNETSNPSTNTPALTSVSRSGQGFTKIPQDIFAMTNLQQLDLSNNLLTGALPAEIRHLQNLQILNISSNRMTGLPAELGQLSKLRILNVSDNQLTGIPHELGNLQNLEVLDLSGNNIPEFDLNEIRKKLPGSTQIII